MHQCNDFYPNRKSLLRNLTLASLATLLLLSSTSLFASWFTRISAPSAVVPSPALNSQLATEEPVGTINPKVYQLAHNALQKASDLGLAQKPLLTIIDYSLPSTEPRLWVVDTEKNEVIYHTHVAHGSGSGDTVAKRFSDIPGSLQTSLGLFLTGKTYQGKHGLSLTLHGLEQGINGNAEKRRIVVHAAPYVRSQTAKKAGRIGRSWGCPALDPKLAKPIINTIKDGSLVFAYYPDKKFMERSAFIKPANKTKQR